MSLDFRMPQINYRRIVASSVGVMTGKTESFGKFNHDHVDDTCSGRNCRNAASAGRFAVSGQLIHLYCCVIAEHECDMSEPRGPVDQHVESRCDAFWRRLFLIGQRPTSMPRYSFANDHVAPRAKPLGIMDSAYCPIVNPSMPVAE